MPLFKGRRKRGREASGGERDGVVLGLEKETAKKGHDVLQDTTGPLLSHRTLETSEHC